MTKEYLTKDRIDKIENIIYTNALTGVFAEYDGDHLRYCFSNGYADRLNLRKNNIETLFGIASGTKLFTALGIGLLIEEQKISLDTPALKVLDLNNPLLDQRMTIRHLLNHTSGLPDYLDESLEDENSEGQLSIPNQKLKSPFDYLSLFPLTKNTSVPGEKFKYNNGAYIYLAMIIETLSGLSYQDFMNLRLLKPMGITRSRVYASDQLPENAALGYYQKSDAWYVNTDKIPFQAGGDGGIYISLLDMKRLWEAFMGGEILSPKLVSEFINPSVCAYPEKGIHYGLGVWLRKISDGESDVFEPYITGSDVGVSFKSSYNPLTKRFVFSVSNTSEGVWQFNNLNVQ